MQLRSLELIGFKSFAKKTILDFPRGITAIVGPNGSGKSNIVDAIRWALAERALQNLRGKKGEDLIFHGGGGRGGMARARVSLNFLGTRNEAPFDMSEIAVTREVDRGGQNTYYLNEQQVRLLDLEEFLSRSGIGGSSFRVLSQGMSDMLLTLGPREFRGFIEEAAGVKEFQDKKHRTRIKLRHTQENIEKTKALLSELAPRLRFLKREVARYTKREEAEKKIRALALELFGFRYHTLTREEQKIASELKAQKRELEAAERLFEKIREELFVSSTPATKEEEKKLKEALTKIQELEKRDHALLEKLVHLQGEKRIEGELSRQTLPVTREYLEASLAAIIAKGEKGSTLGELLSTLRHLLHEISEGRKSTVDREARLSELVKNITALEGEREHISADLARMRERRRELEKALEKDRSSLRGKEGVYREKDEELRRLRDVHSSLILEEEKIRLRRTELEREIKMFGIVTLTEVGQSRLQVIDEEQKEAEFIKARRAFELIGGIDPAVEGEYKGLQERYDFLSREKDDLERALSSLSTLIRELEGEIKIRFSETLVDMSEAFASYFRLMFNGGKGALHLVTLKEKPEESPQEEGELEELEEEIGEGIEIRTEIPGKKIKNLGMLSGGERTLVSIALLFALVNVRRPPFLVLDEIDAALDETNSQRFIRLLGELAKSTQFIIITHNRETMRGADALYGVSMKDGISHLLSLKLEGPSSVR